MVKSPPPTYLLWLNLRTTFFRLYEFIWTVIRYYPQFLWIDLLFALHYFVTPPYRVSKRFLKKRGELDFYSYGETPLTTLDRIARECRILSHDVVMDLGSGTGRTSFWLARFIRCRVIGVDYLPMFTKKAQKIQRWAPVRHLSFKNEDMLETDFREATVVYLYGTLLKDAMIQKLCEKFASLSKARFITISYSLEEYDARFCTVKQFSVRFPWGKADVFLSTLDRACGQDLAPCAKSAPTPHSTF